MNRIVISLLTLFPLLSFGQTHDLGQPVSWNLHLEEVTSSLTLPAVNNEAESMRELARRSESTEKRYVFGKEQRVNVDLIQQSEKTTLSNGDLLYRYEINSKTAKSINLVFTYFNLVQGARLYVYDSKKTEFIGAHTFINNNVQNILGTDLIHSDKIVVELVEPADRIGGSKLVLGKVIHGFRDLEEDIKSLNESGDCMYDVNCAIGAAWKDQRNSVGIIIDGTGFCSGSLVNNTSGIIKPYFLTANHCVTSGTPGSWVFRFRYESPEGQADCATSAPSVDGPKNKNINGGVIKSKYAASDFCLILLNNTPDPTWGIFYNGWDRTGAIPLSGTGIHHPSGDVMKISFEYQPLVSTTYGSSPNNSHWGVSQWDAGVTEGGSSGSPLFDQNRRVIGQLHGGASECGNAPDQLSDEYGKFSVSWLGGATPETRLSDWLDPNNVGSTIINGVDPANSGNTLDAGVGSINNASGTICSTAVSPSITLINNGTSNLVKATIKYGYDGVLNQTYNWTGNLVKNASVEINFPTVNLAGGTHTFGVDIIKANDLTDQNTANNTASSSFKLIAQPRIIDLNLNLDCFGYETTWNLRNEATNQIVESGGPYNQSSVSVAINKSFCLTAGCYKFEIMDSFNDGFSGGSGCPVSVKGSYTIKDEKGTVLAEIKSANADFGSLNIQTFCLTAVGLTTEELTDSWELFPNPASGEVMIQMNTAGNKSVRIFDPAGKEIYSMKSDEITQKIATDSFSKGIYIVQLQVNGVTSFKRLIVQ